MDSKLEEYRAQKRRDATLNTIKTTLYSMIPFQNQNKDEEDKSSEEQVTEILIWFIDLY